MQLMEEQGVRDHVCLSLQTQQVRGEMRGGTTQDEETKEPHKQTQKHTHLRADCEPSKALSLINK